MGLFYNLLISVLPPSVWPLLFYLRQTGTSRQSAAERIWEEAEAGKIHTDE